MKNINININLNKNNENLEIVPMKYYSNTAEMKSIIIQ